MAEYETELVVGICQFLHDVQLGHFDPTGALPNPDNLPPIGMMQPHPAGRRAISVNLYGSESLELAQIGRQLVQIAFRTGEDPREVTEFLGRIKSLFDGRTYLTLGNVRASMIRYSNYADLGLTSDTPPMRDNTANLRFTGLRYVRPGN